MPVLHQAGLLSVTINRRSKSSRAVRFHRIASAKLHASVARLRRGRAVGQAPA